MENESVLQKQIIKNENTDNQNIEVQRTEQRPTIIKEDTKETKCMKNQYPFFVVSAIVYAIFYTFCLYKNASGITAPFFIAGTFLYLFFGMKKMEISMKKTSIFYMVALMLLGFSLMLTDDTRIIVMNYIGILLLLLLFVFHQFYQDKDWGFGKYSAVTGDFLIEILAALGAPFSYAKYYAEKNKKEKENTIFRKNITYILIGIGICIPLFIVVLALLISADRIFGDYFIKLVRGIVIPENLFGTIFLSIFIFFLAFCSFAAIAKRTIKEEVVNKRTQEPLIAITFTSIMTVLYLLFCAIQIAGLFLGELSLPKGYTYAAYAREGFFQLLAVCIINLALVLACLAYFKEHIILRILLTLISLCTYIMVASSTYRMLLYIKVYQLTFLRIFVLWSLLVIAVLMGGIVISIYRKSFPVFRYAVVIITVFYIGFAYSHPDYFIARENIRAMYTEDNYKDMYYLTSLSADAAPIMVEYANNKNLVKSEEQMTSLNYFFEKIQKKTDKISIRSFNVSRFIAKNGVNQSLK